ncbi:hypothetical protein CCMA1212_002456 [Trichoderma ghanense]|uniref:Uncharacterized protein n=1 Tax=Trichoderma ghanense TaxID=65468 RepID=A0ABY2HBJ8_9HYPO
MPELAFEAGKERQHDIRVTSMPIPTSRVLGRAKLDCFCSFSKAKSFRTVLYGSSLEPPFSPYEYAVGMQKDDPHRTMPLHYDCGGVGLSRTLSEQQPIRPKKGVELMQREWASGGGGV